MQRLANDMTKFALRPTDSGMLERMGLAAPAWRTAEAQSNPQREGFLEMAFVIDTWQRMDPRSKKRRSSADSKRYQRTWTHSADALTQRLC